MTSSDGAARGHHVLDHQASLAGGQREPAPEPHDSVLALREERARAEARATSWATRMPPIAGASTVPTPSCRNGAASASRERRSVDRVLQHQRGLEIHVGVKAGGQPEVAVQQGASGLVQVEGLRGPSRRGELGQDRARGHGRIARAGDRSPHDQVAGAGGERPPRRGDTDLIVRSLAAARSGGCRA